MLIEVESEKQDDMHCVGLYPMIKFLLGVEILDLEDHDIHALGGHDTSCQRRKLLDVDFGSFRGTSIIFRTGGYSWICKTCGATGQKTPTQRPRAPPTALTTSRGDRSETITCRYVLVD